jgi:hypothetical protein
MAYVYRHIRLDKNEPFYIGIGSDANGKFSRAHHTKRNTIHQKITNKTDFKIEIVLDDLSWEEACEKEKELIKLYGRIDLGTGILANMTIGGDGIIDLSEESRKIMSEKARLNHLLYPEKYKHTPEQIKKISAALIGKTKSKEHRANLSTSKLGKKLPSLTERHKARISECRTGQARPDVSNRNRQRVGPCAGKVRITDGTHSKFIDPTIEIPTGWYKWKSNLSKVTCPHCNKDFTKINARRWHFDNCKSKNNTTL